MKSSRGQNKHSVMPTHTWKVAAAEDFQIPSVQIEVSKADIFFGRKDLYKNTNVPFNITMPIVQPGNFNKTTDSLYSALKPIMVLAQCFALVPVSGVYSKDASCLKFSWRSPRILYQFISLIGAGILYICSMLRLSVTGITSTKTTNIVFFGSTCIASLLFLRLAKHWPCLSMAWEEVERELSSRYRRTSKISLAFKFRLMTVTVMTLALFEHVLSVLAGYKNALECAKLRGDTNIVSTYFQSQFPQVFGATSYAHWKSILVQIVNSLSTFSWNFMDLFLVLMSFALADQFRQLNKRLYEVRGKAMPAKWWSEARSDYNKLASLTRRVDGHISYIVLLSFASNLYFICIQLLNSFSPTRDTIQTAYFWFSFGFLIVRTAAVSLYAASVHDESLLPAPILYSVPDSSYSIEVVRFLTQVTTDSISITGMKFFSITRSLVLTIAGTIVTYELVLVQFNTVQQTDPASINFTDACGVK
ncbi:Gustatory receptor 1 [Cephus cinctus]|uniref:Gustatory receptor for sugar taste 64f isoform X2 n=1 Tax=Cephus cinctus TaxID=211228 RepID=A0A3L9M0V3_CEPCN|nr:gustatory receptor for sugar taste 64f isoform X2 [Cephus cinctus]RLZ02213.1 Gustatory receptor 1 [Cephus cinctus]